ncbi:hypothetical protein F5X96DRAFT_328689 [Biscogniauxia mediterranea]|nr:hypothetical protein F5X96DRAFT_328689 [Biscogniauxia mediterranea]
MKLLLMGVTLDSYVPLTATFPSSFFSLLLSFLLFFLKFSFHLGLSNLGCFQLYNLLNYILSVLTLHQATRSLHARIHVCMYVVCIVKPLSMIAPLYLRRPMCFQPVAY